MEGRWARAPAPVVVPLTLADGTQVQTIDSWESRIDIYPGETEPLDVVVRLDDDEECYGWSNDTYLRSTVGRNPEWRLNKGIYLVSVTIRSSGQSAHGVFRLVNDVPYSACRLEAATSEERQKINELR
jgi:hypothetical protein